MKELMNKNVLYKYQKSHHLNKIFQLTTLVCFLYLSGCNQNSTNPNKHSWIERPQLLVQGIQDKILKNKLSQCTEQLTHLKKSNFSIGHRGAPLYYPEHTKEGYLAASDMGAGMMECDVALTKDAKLVCRHSFADLHRTTDVLRHPELSSKCTQPFIPANPETGEKAKALCRTTDFTLKEFKTLKGKIDNINPEATTAETYIAGVKDWRTKLFGKTYTGPATLLSHKESIELFKSLNVKMIPELKQPSTQDLQTAGLTQEEYADLFVQEYIRAGIPPNNVYLQTGKIEDIEYWSHIYPNFAKQAVFGTLGSEVLLSDLSDMGVKIIAPIYTSLIRKNNEKVELSNYAKEIKKYNFKIISWTMDRNYSAYNELEVMDTLYQQLGIIGLFSDWPATTSFYANCMID